MLFLASFAAWAQDPPSAVITEVHRSEMQVATAYAEVLAEPTPGALRCMVRVVVDGSGAPSAASVTGCEEPWATMAADTVMKGRWTLKDGQTAPIAFTVPIDGHRLVESTALDVVVHPGAEPTGNLDDVGGVRCTVRLHGTGTGAVDAAAALGECPEPSSALLAAMVRAWTVDGSRDPFYGDVHLAIAEDGRVFYRHSVVVVTKAPKPRYPQAAKLVYPEDSAVECRLRVKIDATGRPIDVQSERCPEVFQRSARRTVMRARWQPAEVDGQAVEAQFPLTLVYALDDLPP